MRETLAFERRFTSDAAHELRTPLAAIRANTQVMQAARTPEEFTTASVNLLASVDRSGRLIEQLLALARVDASASLPQRFEVVDLAPLVHAQIAEHERFAARRRVELEASTEPARVRGDRELLSVLLRNLVDNAIRYSRPDTRVVISCDTLADGVELVVNDEGVGVVPEERTRIFERFYRASGTHDYGSGLGLSIVKRIADLHGASVTVSTGAGQRGSRFRLWFPKPTAERSD
jgi:two-component system OmpR family sensor kinase/two-component system sensor histidine kinase QseC